MKGTPHSEEQIIAILKQGEAGLSTSDLCRQHNITEQTYYRWKAKYGGMDSSEAKKLKQLEDENRKLKHVVAELTLDNRALKDVVSKNKPVQNAYAESFNGRLRDECLNANWFTSLRDARRKIESWRQDYNQQRPHSSLNYLPPLEFARTLVEMRA